MPSKIEWCQETWNPITGCTQISEGCSHCYAERMSKRLAGRYGYPKNDPFRVIYHPDRIDQPLHWKKPRIVFVCSMGDIFHNDVDDWAIDRVMDRIWAAECNHHTFLILTKRPARMFKYFASMMNDQIEKPNLWLGVTAENQRRADERIPILLKIPAAVRFVSVEPMLGLVNITHNDTIKGYLDWVICGAETGPGARPMKLGWAGFLKDQCAKAEVPFFFKKDSQGKRTLGGRLYEQYPT